MHKEILTPEQVTLMPLLKIAGRDFTLVGGTAVALQIGHRRSIDFDLFSHDEFKNPELKRKVSPVIEISKVLVNRTGEYTFLCGGVKITFYQYPYTIECEENFDGIIKIPNLLTLAAMKAFALGQRAKWKDYVDLYFILKKFHTLADVVKKGDELFGGEFNEKLFRIQLSYFKDINYEEKVDFLPGFAVSEERVKKQLTAFSLQ